MLWLYIVCASVCVGCNYMYTAQRFTMNQETSGASPSQADSPEVAHFMGDGFSLHELLGMIREKDRLLTDLLGRLALSARSGTADVSGVPTFQVMPDLSKNISNFDGGEDAAAARDWMENLKRTATLHKWPTAFLLETAKSHLTGAAKDWLRSRHAEIASWEDLEYQFRRTLVSQTRAAERWRRMQHRVQQQNESTIAYFHSKIRLCGEENLDFCDTREQVLTGLRSRQLCTMLMGRTHEDGDDLLHDIQEFERIDRERQERFGGQREKGAATGTQRNRDPGMTSVKKTIDERNNKDKRSPIHNEKGERKCYNCSRFGHIACDCPEPKRPLKCLSCGKTGHTQRHCIERAPRSETNAVSNSKERSFSEVLLKQVTWNGDKKLIGMIDTGSSGCLLRASAAARCGAELMRDATPLYGFGNQDVPAVRTIGKCKADLDIDGVTGKNITILLYQTRLSRSTCSLVELSPSSRT
ncbi:uncharacterized protein LOC120846931 [Ixodes scapularis]|uniref:uncharacterized protein LOC120846931 n=1 Tax=Ixodes scapularis TaxID=6945 RepID=UPI001A9D5886|nr:uncharacterized protein LOC120846931 [Ixodes scapularis]